MVAPDDTNSSSTPRSFEEELAALEDAVERLEEGDMTLEEAIRSFERGFRSMKRCYGILENAQRRIEALCTEAGLGVEGGVEGERSRGDSSAGPVSAWKPLNLKPLPQLDDNAGGSDEEAPSGAGTRRKKRPAGRRRAAGERPGETRPGETEGGGEGISYADDFAPGDD